jgi:hypothetical protein
MALRSASLSENCMRPNPFAVQHFSLNFLREHHVVRKPFTPPFRSRFTSLFASKTVRLISLVALFVAIVPVSRAQIGEVQPANLSGRYQCAQAKIRGKVVPCKAAPLTLKNDGRFELRGWEGSYLVDGEWVELSDTVVRSRARIEPGHKIVFRYHGKHGWCEMVYERRLAELGKTNLG